MSENHSNENHENGHHDSGDAKSPSKLENIAMGVLAGLITNYIFPAATPLYALGRAAFFGAISPLADKLIYPKVKLGELYKNAPLEGAGFFGGQYLQTLAQYVI
ncbi:MAG: hypothetical protein QS98_C0001G0051 [archaeon GW2011_AR3]|nr:MAG: hypothetical protein QS98_C0001G0051 [archaeon GW2011_AR3]MBS3109328.1 hypothetical protein [Candidatus Woesearchaeota archaeon]